MNWDGVGYFSLHTDKLNNFQLLIVDRSNIAPGDFDIVFNYQQVQWETGDASGGSGGLGGSSARAGYSNGVSTSYELSGSAVNGGFLDSNATTGLINGSANSSTPGQYVYAVRNGSPLAADISITKTAQPDPVTVGDQLTYTLAVHNAGPDAAADVQATDTLPPGVTFVSAGAGCTEDTGTVTCSLGTIASGGDETRDIVVTPTEANPELSNTATVSTSTGDPDLGNNSSTATTAVNANSCPTPAPNAPGTPTAFGGNTTAALSWDAPSTGPTPDTYTVFVHHGESTSSVEGITDTQAQINGLTNGETYSFTVAGVNCAGPGAESGSSNEVTPASGTSAEVIGPGNLSQETAPGQPTTNVPEIGAQQFPTGTTGIGTVQLLQNAAAARVPTLNFCNGVPCLGFVVEHKLLNGTVGGRPSGKVFYSSRIIYDRTLATGTGTSYKVWYDGNLGDDDTAGGDPTPPHLIPRCGSTVYKPVACVAKIVRLASRDLKVVVRTSETDPRIGVR